MCLPRMLATCALEPLPNLDMIPCKTASSPVLFHRHSWVQVTSPWGVRMASPELRCYIESTKEKNGVQQCRIGERLDDDLGWRGWVRTGEMGDCERYVLNILGCHACFALKYTVSAWGSPKSYRSYLQSMYPKHIISIIASIPWFIPTLL